MLHNIKCVSTLLVRFNVVLVLGAKQCKTPAFGFNVGVEMSTN